MAKMPRMIIRANFRSALEMTIIPFAIVNTRTNSPMTKRVPSNFFNIFIFLSYVYNIKIRKIGEDYKFNPR